MAKLIVLAHQAVVLQQQQLGLLLRVVQFLGQLGDLVQEALLDGHGLLQAAIDVRIDPVEPRVRGQVRHCGEEALVALLPRLGIPARQGVGWAWILGLQRRTFRGRAGAGSGQRCRGVARAAEGGAGLRARGQRQGVAGERAGPVLAAIEDDDRVGLLAGERAGAEALVRERALRHHVPLRGQAAVAAGARHVALLRREVGHRGHVLPARALSPPGPLACCSSCCCGSRCRSGAAVALRRLLLQRRRRR
mmetsp:Transcript_20972/g.53146  ORF Transcript_20972/g.53146 Transcript_20972/m.53146 type:complete len:249 (+) Transcript_20972:328-1074(+)